MSDFNTYKEYFNTYKEYSDIYFDYPAEVAKCKHALCPFCDQCHENACPASSPLCRSAQGEIERAQERERYVATWPHYCKTCKGNGQFTESYDPSPSGVSLSAGSMNEVSPCDDCTSQGICPRCGGLGLTCEERYSERAYPHPDETTGKGPCSYCGWDYEQISPL